MKKITIIGAGLKCPESGSSTLRAILSIKACNSSNSNTVRIRVTIVGSTLNVQDFITCREHGNNKNIDMICSAYESFLETKSSSGTPNPKIFESQIRRQVVDRGCSLHGGL
jgi:hypothetical protein